MRTLLNYTPHPLNLWIDGEEVVIPSSGIARVEEIQTKLSSQQFLINGIGSVNVYSVPVIMKEFKKDVIGLPPEKVDFDGNNINDEIYIVSALVKGASSRKDLVGIGEFKRNEKGMIIGAFSLDMDTSQIESYEMSGLEARRYRQQEE